MEFNIYYSKERILLSLGAICTMVGSILMCVEICVYSDLSKFNIGVTIYMTIVTIGFLWAFIFNLLTKIPKEYEEIGFEVFIGKPILYKNEPVGICERVVLLEDDVILVMDTNKGYSLQDDIKIDEEAFLEMLRLGEELENDEL